MTNSIFNPQSRTLGDILLEVIENISQNEEQKSFVRKLRILLGVPEFSEYLNCLLVNALGYPTPIAAGTVDKAIDCLICFYEDNIEATQGVTVEQKTSEKRNMRFFMEEYRHAVKNSLSIRNLSRVLIRKSQVRLTPTAT